MRVEFTVYGKPQPQGSAKAFIPKGWNRAIITSDNKTLKPWRQDVSAMAAQAMIGGVMTENAVRVLISFFWLRPKSTKKSVAHKITKPDIDKCLRSILDSLTGIVFQDDSQVVECHIFKRFGQREGARVIVEEV